MILLIKTFSESIMNNNIPNNNDKNEKRHLVMFYNHLKFTITEKMLF